MYCPEILLCVNDTLVCLDDAVMGLRCRSSRAIEVLFSVVGP